MPQNKKVAIVILNWNGAGLLEEFLPSVIRNSPGENIRIIVADNGSSDHSVEFLRTNFPSVEILVLNQNYGFAEGYNQALKQVEADYFVLLNSDVEVTANWIGPCINLMEANPAIAAVQPKILSYRQRDYFEYAGAAGGFIDFMGYPFCRGRLLNVVEKDDGQYNQSSPVFWATGACMFARADVFREAGGFDGDFWAHMEEIDLCWRLKNRGYEVWYEPRSTVYHLGGGTLSYDSPQKVYLNFRNNLWMLQKNLPKGYIFPMLLIRLLLDGVAAFKFLAGFSFSSFFAVLKAHFSFYRSLGKFRRKRESLLGNVVVSGHREIYRSGLMWKFFILGKKKFSDLDFKGM